MKTLNRRIFIGAAMGTAIVAAIPALPEPWILRRGPVNMRVVSFFGPSSLKAMLISDSREDTLSLLPLESDGDVTQIVMPLSQIASIVHRRGQGEFSTIRVEGRQTYNFRLILQAQRKQSNVVRLINADEVAQGNKPDGVFLRLKDIRAVLPKA